MASTDLARFDRLAKQAKSQANEHDSNAIDSASSSDSLRRWTLISLQNQVDRALRDLQSSSVPAEERERSKNIQAALISAQQSLQQRAQVRVTLMTVRSEAAH